jgi:hypothetical protein
MRQRELLSTLPGNSLRHRGADVYVFILQMVRITLLAIHTEPWPTSVSIAQAVVPENPRDCASI